MPRKVDYELIGKAQLARKNLWRQSAIINAIRDGNINKAELLSGEQLVPRNPIYQGLVKKEKEKENSSEKRLRDDRKKADEAIVTELRAIVDKPYPNSIELLEDIRELLKAPKVEGAIPLPAIKEKDEGAVGGAPDVMTIDLDKNVDPDIMGEYGKLSNHFKKKDIEELKYLNERLKGDIRTLNGEAIHNVDVAKRRDEVVKYRKKLTDVIRALEYEVHGSGIMTTLGDLKERLQLLVGSIESGNGSKELKNELADILHYLYKNKKLNKSTYKTLMNLTM